jgi:hypothetical protein
MQRQTACCHRDTGAATVRLHQNGGNAECHAPPERAAHPSRHAAREQVCMTRVHAARRARKSARASSKFAALRRPRTPLTAMAAAAAPMQRSALLQLRCSRRKRPRQQHAERLQGRQHTMRAPACACAVRRRAQPAASAQQEARVHHDSFTLGAGPRVSNVATLSRSASSARAVSCFAAPPSVTRVRQSNVTSSPRHLARATQQASA